MGRTKKKMATRTLFKAKIAEGNVIKVLVEILSNITAVIPICIDATGIHANFMDSQRTSSICLDLDHTKFSVFEFNSVPLYLGVTATHLNKLLKSIRRKEIVTLSMDASDQSKLWIAVRPKENGIDRFAHVHVHDVQNVGVRCSQDYTHCVKLQSADFQRAIKELHGINANRLVIQAFKHKIRFAAAEAADLFGKYIDLGDLESESETEPLFKESFDTEHFFKIIKISGISGFLYVHTHASLPLMIKSDVGTIGTISFFIKTEAQQQASRDLASV